MGDTHGDGFGKFVPGFDFLQNLAKGASQSIPQIPNLANWVSPSLNVEDLEKRIEELRAVHFWLEQNSRALGATIQALEVQKMTLATLKGMNFNIGDVANAFKLKAADSVTSGVQMAAERAVSTAKSVSDAASAVGDAAKAGTKKVKAAGTAASLVDPLQLWGSLTRQFQQIAASALQDVNRSAGTGLAEAAGKEGKAGKKSKAGKKATGAGASTRKTPSRAKPARRSAS